MRNLCLHCFQDFKVDFTLFCFVLWCNEKQKFKCGHLYSSYRLQAEWACVPIEFWWVTSMTGCGAEPQRSAFSFSWGNNKERGTRVWKEEHAKRIFCSVQTTAREIIQSEFQNTLLAATEDKHNLLNSKSSAKSIRHFSPWRFREEVSHTHTHPRHTSWIWDMVLSCSGFLLFDP